MAVGTTRITGHAGAAIDLRAFLAGDLSEMEVPVIINSMGWSYGTGAGAVDVIYADTITLADAGTITIDLNASGLYLDIFTRALTFEAVKFVYIKNNSADATLEVLGTAVTALGICKDVADIILIKPGGILLWTDPSAAGLDCNPNVSLKLLHDGTGDDTMDIDLIIMGLD